MFAADPQVRSLFDLGGKTMRTSFFVACLALSVLVPSTPAAAQSAQDKAIAQEIGSQLKTSGQLHDYRIGVKYKDGVAALSGTVANQQQLVTAVRLTQQMNSVSQVINKLTIAGDTPSSQPAQKSATPAAFTSAGAQSPRAVRTSYQPAGPQPTDNQPTGPQNQGQYGQQPNQTYMARRQPMGPQRPMSANRMQAPRRNNTPMPMGGRPPIQLAMAQQPMQQPMGAMQAGCNCGPGGGGMMGGGGGMMGGPPAAMGYGRPGRGSQLRQRSNAGLRLAELRFVPELRGAQLPATVFAVGLAVHRSVLPLSAGAARLAEGLPRMG